MMTESIHITCLFVSIYSINIDILVLMVCVKILDHKI